MLLGISSEVMGSLLYNRRCASAVWKWQIKKGGRRAQHSTRTLLPATLLILAVSLLCYTPSSFVCVCRVAAEHHSRAQKLLSPLCSSPCGCVWLLPGSNDYDDFSRLCIMWRRARAPKRTTTTTQTRMMTHLQLLLLDDAFANSPAQSDYLLAQHRI